MTISTESGQLLFGRLCKVTIRIPVSTPNDFTHTSQDVIVINDGIDDRGASLPRLRVTARIKKTLEKEPNTAEITVYNLSPASRASLQAKGVKVLLEAGYKGTGLSRYCCMDVRTVDHVRVGPDWTTVLKLGDGERAWRFARVNESFACGSKVGDVIVKIARNTGLDLGNVEMVAAGINKVFDSGWVAAGNAMQALEKVCKSVGLSVSVQDGELQLLGKQDALDLPIPEISPTTGLIGSPEMGSPPTKGKPQLLRFKSLLVHVKPGAEVKLKSERYDGIFLQVRTVTFDLDTHQGPWYAVCDAVQVPEKAAA